MHTRIEERFVFLKGTGVSFLIHQLQASQRAQCSKFFPFSFFPWVTIRRKTEMLLFNLTKVWKPQTRSSNRNQSMSYHADVPWVSVKTFLFHPVISTLHLPTKKKRLDFSLSRIGLHCFQSRGRDSSASPSTTPVLVLLELFQFLFFMLVPFIIIQNY